MSPAKVIPLELEGQLDPSKYVFVFVGNTMHLNPIVNP